jgi:hypothetical protein
MKVNLSTSLIILLVSNEVNLSNFLESNSCNVLIKSDLDNLSHLIHTIDSLKFILLDR